VRAGLVTAGRVRARLRAVLLDLEDAVVELHAAEERAAGRSSRVGDVDRAERLYLGVRERVGEVEGRLTREERERLTALLDTVGLLLAARRSLGADSIAARLLS